MVFLTGKTRPPSPPTEPTTERKAKTIHSVVVGGGGGAGNASLCIINVGKEEKEELFKGISVFMGDG